MPSTEDKLKKLAKEHEESADRILADAERRANAGNSGVLGAFNNLWQLVLINLIVVAMAAGTIWFGWRGYTLTSTGGETTGRVVSLEESSDGEGGCCVYSPVIEYEANGSTYSFESMNASSPPVYAVGQRVEIVYNSDNPSDAAINSWYELWLVPSLLCPATVLLAVILNLVAFNKIRNGEPIWDSD